MRNNPTLPKHKRLKDLLVVILVVCVAIIIALYLKPNFLGVTLLFFGLPSLYLISKKPSNLKKATVAGLLFGLLWGFSFDFVAELNQAWSWSSEESLLFPRFFFGVVSLDIMIWFFLWIFTVITFYEYFAEYDFSQKISLNVNRSAIMGALVLVILLVVFKIKPELLVFPYTYFWLGLLALLPFTYVSLKRPRLFPKFLEVVPFFVFLYLAFEVVALKLGLWSFSG